VPKVVKVKIIINASITEHDAKLKNKSLLNCNKPDVIRQIVVLFACFVFGFALSVTIVLLGVQ